MGSPCGSGTTRTRTVSTAVWRGSSPYTRRLSGRPRIVPTMSTCATPTVLRYAFLRRQGASPGDRHASESDMARENKNLIVALDIGTSKVVAMVAELFPDGRMDIVGTGGHESKGLKKGVVVNIEATVNAIQRTLEEAELMADCKIERVFTGIAGSHIKSFNSTGMVAIKDKEVTPIDVERSIETARAMPIPTDQQVLHILTQEFIIDGQDGVREPLGMSGVRLELKVRHGCALRQLAEAGQMIEVAGVGDRPPRMLSRQTLAEVIEPRVEELYTLIQQVLRDSGYEELLSSGVVLTGGSAVMQGMVELGEEIFHMPVRLGIPRYTGSLSDVVRSPRYATGVGLLLEGVVQTQRGLIARQGGSLKQVAKGMRQWFQRNF